MMRDTEVKYHIQLSEDDLEGARLAILTGDPGRVVEIAKYLNNPRKIGQNREYTSYLGELEGQKILVISTGIGGPSTAICVEEIAMIGIKYLIRVGTSGGMRLDVEAGDIVIPTGSIRQEGTSREYLPIEFPAVPDFLVVSALKEAVEMAGYKNHLGVVHCKDSFYGQHSPSRMPVSYELENKWNAWIKAGCLCSEMETAALFTISQTLGLHAGTVLLVIWNQEREKRGLDNKSDFDVEKEIKVAIEALRILILKYHV